MSKLRYYVLKDRKALPTYSVLKWGRMLEDMAGCTVAQTMFDNAEPWTTADRQREIESEARRIALGMEPRDVLALRTHPLRILVSTVFLGLDHSWGRGPPLLFETMIFNGPLNEYQERYTTWEEAEAGHRHAVEEVGRALVATARLVSDDLPAADDGVA